jgi:3-oxoacyl-[acyl-carrier-protein] synthase-3
MPELATTLQRIAIAAPRRSISVEEAGRAVGLNRYQARLFRRIHGLDRLNYDREMDMFDLVAAPARMVLRAAPAAASSIRYLVFGHSISNLTPSSIAGAERLCETLGLADVDTFAVTHINCVSGIESLDIAGELLRASGDPTARALVVTGEMPEARDTRIVHNVCLLGHAASACLVGLDGRGTRVRSYAVHTAGQFSEGLWLRGELLAQFEDTYLAQVVDVIHEALDRAEMAIEDITMVVPHNVNVSSWLRLCKRLGLPRDRVFLDNVPRYSHTYSTDLFLNLATMRERGLLVVGGRYLMVTVGLGATYAAMVLEH